MTDLDPSIAEAAVLGACLLSETACDEAITGLSANDFTRNAHRSIWQAIGALHGAGKTVDQITVGELLARQGRLDEVGGHAALYDLTAQVPSVAGQRHYVSIVADHARRRDLLDVARSLSEAAADGSKPLPATVQTTRDMLDGMRPVGRRLSVFRDDELDHLPEVEWLVEGMVQHRGFNLVYGPWKHGKSFVTLDMALTLLSGASSWHGLKTSPLSSVVYVAPEGAAGYRNRRQAWRTLNRTHPKGFTLVASPLSLLDPADVGEVDGIVGETSAQLLVVDTWARSIGGDENSQQDAGDAVKALDRIRDRHGCAVLVVHHSGHMEQGRTRGASALPAAADAQVKVSKSGDTVTVVTDFAKEAKTSLRGLSLSLVTAGPSAALKLREVKPAVSDDEMAERVRRILRSRDVTVRELEAAIDGRSDVVDRVLSEPSVQVVDALVQPAKYRMVEV